MNLLTVKQVAAKLNCSVSSVWRLVHLDPTFPKSVNLAPNSKRATTRWVDGAIDLWIAEKTGFSNNQQEVLTNGNENGRAGENVRQGAREEITA